MKKLNGTPYYPVFLNVRGKRCAVVGGGQVALRKVKALLEHGASVEVISPDICPELGELAESGEIQAMRREYRTGDLKGCFMAIAATDSGTTNLEVSAEARKRGVLINVVDDAENSDFIVPSCMRRGDITVAVSTSGRSPALARKLRTRLEKDFGDELAALALLVDEVRTELKQREIKIESEAWQEALDLDTLIDLLRKGEREKARVILTNNLKTGKQFRTAGR
ncbi:MAG: bifunctional precorrin-2 dehydrogenase/sirohydrochlorin ferrochelatase [Chloroflexi bacterium]|nr:bifunctional precorrin-2 dehydrogenase/sirohydrochlorin ferrochelatase [Chloroflexota bacterium]